MKKKTYFIKELLLFAATLLGTSAYSYADAGGLTERVDVSQSVSGVVLDSQGESLIGATVMIQGTTIGTIVNEEGKYSLNAEKGDVLVAKFVGYKSMSKTVGDESVINFKLEDDNFVLEEAVAVGYGSMEKREVTSSITSVRNKDLIPGVNSSPLMSMQGKVTGLTMVSSQGSDPNASVSIQLRGANSVNASQGPLVVVDGVPGGNISNIPREDIVSIDVLKDASAAAIYGTRASGGVILVTTKQAKEGPVTVTYSSEFTTETIRRKAEVLSKEEFLEYGQGDDLGDNTDWFDLVTRTPFSHRHNVAMSGGSDKFSIYTSLNYKNAEGVAIISAREEISGRINFNYKALEDILEFSGSVNYSNSKVDKTNYGIFNQALKINPTRAAFDENDLTGYNVWTGGWDMYNPVADVYLREDQTIEKRLQASLTTKVNITDKLTTQLMVATKDNNNHDVYWRSAQHRSSRESGNAGYAKQAYGHWNDITLDWITNYRNDWGKHRMSTMVGYSFQEFNGEGFDAVNEDFPVDGLKWHDMNTGTFLGQGRAHIGSWKDVRTRLIAFFGRANYNYDDRYLVTVSARYEGSSKFADGNRWGLFPSVSAGWRMSNEDFMSNISWLNNFRIRGGWGRTGNEGFAAGKSVRMYGRDGWWLSNGQWIMPFGSAHNVNTNLQWETKDEINVGFDFAILKNRILGKLDVYNRKSNHLIYDINVPVPPAVHDRTTMNVGDMTNKGFELELTGVVVNKDDLNYTTTVRLAKNKNTLNSLWGSQTSWDRKGFPSPGNPGEAVRLAPGEDIGQFYVWKHAGVSEDGKFMIINKEGEEVLASQKTMEDKQFVGNALPKVILSWDNTLTYGRFDVSAFFRSWIGHDIFNMQEMYYGLKYTPQLNVLKTAYEKNAHINDEKHLTDYWIEDGSFLKLDALTVGYDINTSSIKDYIGAARVYITGRDLFTWTKYSGLDPEVNINGLEPGFEELSVYPKTRTFVLGFQITF